MALNVKSILRRFNGGNVDAVGSPLGAGMVANEIDQMIAKGMGRVANTGAFSTPIVGGGNGDVILIDEPEMIIGIPNGYTIRPIRIEVEVQLGAIADGNESEVLIAADIYGLWSGDGTSTAESPVNMRTDLGEGSACRVGSAVTGAITTTPAGAGGADPVLDLELSRFQTEWDVLTSGTVMRGINHLYEPRNPPYIVGPATLLVYFGGDVATVGGFIQAAWVEGRNQDFFS